MLVRKKLKRQQRRKNDRNKERREQTKRIKKETWSGIPRTIKMNAWALRTNLMKRTLHFSIAEPILVRMLLASDHYYVTSADYSLSLRDGEIQNVT